MIAEILKNAAIVFCVITASAFALVVLAYGINKLLQWVSDKIGETAAITGFFLILVWGVATMLATLAAIT